MNNKNDITDYHIPRPNFYPVQIRVVALEKTKMVCLELQEKRLQGIGGAFPPFLNKIFQLL